jgi:hypothetical protein
MSISSSHQVVLADIESRIQALMSDDAVSPAEKVAILRDLLIILADTTTSEDDIWD